MQVYIANLGKYNEGELVMELEGSPILDELKEVVWLFGRTAGTRRGYSML